MSYLLPDSTVALVDSFVYADADDRLSPASWPYRTNRYAADLWWTPTRFAGVNLNVGVDQVANGASRVEWDRFVPPTGAQSQKLITGITYDETGAVLAGVTVKAYRTSADAPNNLPADLEEGPAVISAADGAYTVCLPNADAHYLVGYKAGSPDKAGTTLNTLLGI